MRYTIEGNEESESEYTRLILRQAQKRNALRRRLSFFVTFTVASLLIAAVATLGAAQMSAVRAGERALDPGSPPAKAVPYDPNIRIG